VVCGDRVGDPQLHVGGTPSGGHLHDWAVDRRLSGDTRPGTVSGHGCTSLSDAARVAPACHEPGANGSAGRGA
jgi:hypothetical protein